MRLPHLNKRAEQNTVGLEMSGQLMMSPELSALTGLTHSSLPVIKSCISKWIILWGYFTLISQKLQKEKKYGWVTVCFTSVATASCVRDSEIQGQRLNCDCRKDGIGLSVRRGVEGLKWNFSVSVSREEWKRIWKTFELSHDFLFHFSLFLFLWFSRWVQTEVKAQSPCLFHRWIK